MSQYHLELLRLHLDEIRGIDAELAKGCGCGSSADALEAQRAEKLQELALAAADFVEEVVSGQPTVSKRTEVGFSRDGAAVLAQSRAIRARANALLRPRRAGR